MDTLLGDLDKTIQYQPHALLATKLRAKLEELKDIIFTKDYSQKQKVATVPVSY